MEENIVNLLKDAFSEVDIDFEHLQLDEAAFASQPQPLLDADMDDVNKPNVYKAEDDDISDNSEDSDSSDLANVNTESTHCLSHAIESDQTEETSVTDVQVLKPVVDECKTKEGSLLRHSEADISLHGLVAEDSVMEGEKKIQMQDASECLHSNLESSEYQLLMENTSCSDPAEDQTPEELSSESGEEEPDNYGALEECGLSEFYGNKENSLDPLRPNDLREFTEEDQEQIAESLADYPSDLSPCQSEECAENLEAQLSIIKDNMKNSSSDEEEHLLGDSTNLNALIGNQEEKKLLNRATRKEENFNMEQQCCPKIDINLKEEAMDADDAREQSDKNGEALCGRDDDDDASYETTGVCLSVKRKVEWKRARQNNIAIEDLVGAEDCKDKEMLNDSSSEKFKGTENDGSLTGFSTVHEESTKDVKGMHYNLVLDQSEANNRDDNQPLYTPTPIKQDAQTLIHDVLLSSELLMTDNNLLLDEYDWDLTGEQIFKNLCDEENQEHIGDTNEDFDDFEENERDWEQEMIRIEAFNQFYGDQDATEDYIRRNHKVTFSLNHDSSDDDEDYSDSTEEEELDNILTPVQTIQPEYHSDSDEPQQKHSYSEKSKPKLRVQHNVTPTQKQSTPKNRCLSLLKSTLALVLVVGMGLAYYWWATETMEPMQ